jgi:hypothetical protein
LQTGAVISRRITPKEKNHQLLARWVFSNTQFDSEDFGLCFDRVRQDILARCTATLAFWLRWSGFRAFGRTCANRCRSVLQPGGGTTSPLSTALCKAFKGQNGLVNLLPLFAKLYQHLVDVQFLFPLFFIELT